MLFIFVPADKKSVGHGFRYESVRVSGTSLYGDTGTDSNIYIYKTGMKNQYPYPNT